MTDLIVKPDPALWYVLHTKSRSEKVVNDILQKKSIEAFLPTAHVRSKRKDRRVMLDLPLFPGYIFVRTNLYTEGYLSILKTPGAVRLIGNKDGPVPVGQPIIESLRIMVNSGESILTGLEFRRGEKIIVVNGPFTGVTGVFFTYKGQGRVVVHIDILGQSASVEVDEDDVKRVE